MKAINEMTSKELVELYNKHSDKPVKEFSDRATAIARVSAILPKKPVRKVERSTEIDWPYLGEKRALKSGTLRAELVQAMRKGATEKELLEIARKSDIDRDKETPNPVKRLHDLLSFIHTKNGFGIKVTDGVYKLVEK